MSKLDFSATDDESLHLQIDETMETETDESLETGKRDAFRSITSDSDAESILTKKPSASFRRSPRKKSQKATQRSVLMPNSETDDTTKEITTSTPLRRSPRKRRQETRRLAIACAQEDTESEDETYLSAATNMQKEKTAKSKKSKTQSGQSERLSSLNSSKSCVMCDRGKIEMKSI
nr:uncharacterized protein LOC117685096 [Crassostrea gigas]